MNETASGAAIFRRAAVQQASEPDRYDEPLKVMRPWTWALGFVLLAAAVTGILWSALVDVPVKVQGRGILLPPGGIVDIVSDTDGRIDRLLVRPGDRVAAGQPIARVDQSEVQLQLALAEGQAADARRQRDALAAFHVREESAADAFRVARNAALTENLRLLEERLGMMQQREEVLRVLSQQNLVNRDRFLFSRVEVFQVREQIAAARNERQQLALDQALKRTQREREILEAERRVDETGRQAEALRERLARLGAVLATHAGRVVEAKVNVGQVVSRGTPLVTVEHDAEGTGAPVAVIYVTAADGKRLAQGMAVAVSPSSTRREEHGVLQGRILRVADVPASSAGLLRTLQNDQLVQSFTQGLGTLFEVTVRLEADPATRSGLKWSTGRGPDFSIESGTLVEADVTVRSVPLIGLAFPALRGSLTRSADAASP
jgi:HlyD family secretion protein